MAALGARKRKDEVLELDRDGKRHVSEVSSGSASPAPVEAPARLYCLCRKNYGTHAPRLTAEDERVMIACDHCDEWYHATCVQIKEDHVSLIDTFVCPPCEQRTFAF